MKIKNDINSCVQSKYFCVQNVKLQLKFMNLKTSTIKMWLKKVYSLKKIVQQLLQVF